MIFLRLKVADKLVAKMNLKVYFYNIIKASSTTIPTIPTTALPKTLRITFYMFIFPY